MTRTAQIKKGNQEREAHTKWKHIVEKLKYNICTINYISVTIKRYFCTRKIKPDDVIYWISKFEWDLEFFSKETREQIHLHSHQF